MPETIDWTYYDEATFSTVAAAEFQLLATPLGASGRTRFITNSPGNSQLKNGESFEIYCIKTWVDSVEVVADLEKMALGSYIRLNILNKEYLQIPLVLAFGAGGWQGEFHEATNTLSRLINTSGDGYKLMIPLKIPEGATFELYVGQALALSAAVQVKIALIGKLTRQ